MCDRAVPRLGRLPNSSRSLGFIPFRFTSLLAAELATKSATDVDQTGAFLPTAPSFLKLARAGDSSCPASTFFSVPSMQGECHNRPTQLLFCQYLIETILAVRVGFEPTEPLRVQRFSRPPDSTTLAPHRGREPLHYNKGPYRSFTGRPPVSLLRCAASMKANISSVSSLDTGGSPVWKNLITSRTSGT